MKIWQLGPAQCRYVTTDRAPHECCGAATANEKEPYCPAHKKLCHRGSGKDWRSLAAMIGVVEQTVRKSKDVPDVQPTVYEVVAKDAKPK